MNIKSRDYLPKIALIALDDLRRVTGGLAIVTPEGNRIEYTHENFMKYIWNR